MSLFSQIQEGKTVAPVALPVAVPVLQPKPLVILHSRSIQTEEKRSFHHFYNNVIEINKFNDEKKLTDFDSKDTVIFVDIRSERGRDWLASNAKYMDDKVDPIVWVKSSGDEDTHETLKYRYETKRLRTNECKDKQSFLHQLFQEAVSPIIGKKKKFISKLLNCLCASGGN